MLDSWRTGGCIDPLGMGAEAGDVFGVLGSFAALFQVSPSCFFLSAPLFLCDSGPAPLVCTILMTLTSVGQEPQPSVPPHSCLPMKEELRDKKESISWSGGGWVLCTSALAIGVQMMQI